MNTRLRSALLVAALLLFVAGLALLAYVLWPLPVSQASATVPANLFLAPP